MKKILVLLSVIVMFSCSESSNEEQNNDILPKKVVFKDINNTILDISENEFIGKKIVQSISYNNKSLYYYTGDLISNIKIYDINSNNLIMEYLFSYENDKLSESIFKNFNENKCEKRLYTHNAADNIDFVYYIGDLLTQDTLYKMGTISIENGEISSKHIQDFITTNITDITYTYDNKNNPQQNTLGIQKINIELDRAIFGNFHNVISHEVVYNNSQYFSNNFTYEYNPDDYPKKVTINSTGSNLFTQIEYFY